MDYCPSLVALLQNAYSAAGSQLTACNTAYTALLGSGPGPACDAASAAGPALQDAQSYYAAYQPPGPGVCGLPSMMDALQQMALHQQQLQTKLANVLNLLAQAHFYGLGMSPQPAPPPGPQ